MVTVADDDDGSDAGTFEVTVLPSIFVLNSTARSALDLSGNAQMTVPGSLVVNSSCASRAIDASGNARVTASQIDVVGGIRATGNAPRWRLCLRPRFEGWRQRPTDRQDVATGSNTSRRGAAGAPDGRAGQ